MKKLFAIILAVVLFATMCIAVFAADYTTEGNAGVSVNYSVAPTYTVTIPTDVTIDADGTVATISAENVVVNKGEYVSVALAEENNFIVKTAEGATLEYTVNVNGVNAYSKNLEKGKSDVVRLEGTSNTVEVEIFYDGVSQQKGTVRLH